MTTPCHALTVDVEDWYQVSAFDDVFTRASWAGLEDRVARSTTALLELFARHDVQATFFTLGCVAERHPGLVRAIVDAGHEIASHGHAHHRVTALTPEAFRADLRRASAAIEAACGVRVVGFRAPSFSIDANSLWAYDVLREEGYRFSSSVFPVRHDHYGLPAFPRHPVRLSDESGRALWEVPMTTWRVLGRNLPVAGGGWLRALPPFVTRRALRAAERDGVPGVVYVHPWEVDPDQPRVPGGSRRKRFRHYLNLHRTETRLADLLRRFRFTTVSRALEAYVASPATIVQALDPSHLLETLA